MNTFARASFAIPAVGLLLGLVLAGAAPVSAAEGVKTAFLHESHGHGGAHRGSHHGGGCFVTTSPGHHTKGIRHWRNPCPHTERKHMNPYHAPHHRPHRPHPAPHW